MNSLIKEIENAIQTKIYDFLQNISKEYDINYNDLTDLWNNMDTSKDVPTKKHRILSENVLYPIVHSVGCPYTFTKGARGW